MKAEIRKAVIIYVPVLHKGYVNFLKKYFNEDYEVWLLHENVVDLLPKFKTYFERDVRRMDTTNIHGILKHYFRFEVWSPSIANIKNGIVELFDEIVMPDEDVSREFIDVFVKDEKQRRKIKLVPIVLRFDKTYASKSFTVDTAISITRKEFHEDHMGNDYDYSSIIMKNAKDHAQKSKDWWRQVGAVVKSYNGHHVLHAYNIHMPDPDIVNVVGDVRSNFDAGQSIEVSTAIHAEASLVAESAKMGISLKDASMYVTTFPCPNCARLIACSGISKLYFEEGYSRLEGKEVLESAGIKIFRVNTKEDEQVTQNVTEEVKDKE